MNDDEYDFFINLGENIIENAKNKETFSVEAVNHLTPIQAFTLGASLIFYGFETNESGCEAVLNKAIKLIKKENESPIH